MCAFPANPVAASTDARDDLARLTRQVEREVAARLAAESIAEQGLRDLYQRQQEIALLESIAAAANEATDVATALQHALSAICGYMHWPLGHCFFVQEEDSSMIESTAIWHDEGEGQFSALRALTEAVTFTNCTGVLGDVFRLNGLACVHAGDAELAKYPRIQAIANAGLIALIAFPVRIGGDIVAVLEFFSRGRQATDEALQRLFAQIGAHLGRVFERRRAKERLMHDALHDPLTQLGNRKLFLERLQYFMNRSRRSDAYQFAVLFIDLDRFKAVNDGLGHQAGDQVIIATAQRLVDCLRADDLVVREDSADVLARLGGDEFTVLLDHIIDPKGAIRVAERLLAALSVPHMISGQTVVVTASIGISLSATGYENVADMLRDADLAMYHAKQQGSATWVMFDQAMQERALRRIQLEAELRQALQRGEVELYYQPIVTPVDGQIRGFEALMRWKHPMYGNVSPAEFIAVAEDSGVINELGSWALGRACAQLKRWQKVSGRPLFMSVNLSAVQLRNVDLIDLVALALHESGIAHGSLKLEITESVVMADPDDALAIIHRLHALGVKLSLDDFGTGYSSLSYLRRLPIGTLKIDRSFVSEMDVHADRRQIVEIVITLARALGLDVIAEGAETVGEVNVLRALECDLIQGYYFHRPMRAEDISSILA